MVAMNETVSKGTRFVFPFQGQDALWEVGEYLGDNRWQCRIVNGTFMGRRFDSIYRDEEAAFNGDHIQGCVALDAQTIKVTDRLGRLRNLSKEPQWRGVISSSGSSVTEATKP